MNLLKLVISQNFKGIQYGFEEISKDFKRIQSISKWFFEILKNQVDLNIFKDILKHSIGFQKNWNELKELKTILRSSKSIYWDSSWFHVISRDLKVISSNYKEFHTEFQRYRKVKMNST